MANSNKRKISIQSDETQLNIEVHTNLNVRVRTFGYIECCESLTAATLVSVNNVSTFSVGIGNRKERKGKAKRETNINISAY